MERRGKCWRMERRRIRGARMARLRMNRLRESRVSIVGQVGGGGKWGTYVTGRLRVRRSGVAGLSSNPEAMPRKSKYRSLVRIERMVFYCRVHSLYAILGSWL